MTNTLRHLATQQIEFARQYTRQLIEDIAADEWFRMPSPAQTHFAWQVGHLAMAQYGLTMLRLRGKEQSDAELITNDFFRAFQKGSRPSPDPSEYPSPDEILRVFDAVHRQALSELDRYQDQDLQDPLSAPTLVYPNKLGSLFFCGFHEMLHAGQIGLLRRMLGKQPLR